MNRIDWELTKRNRMPEPACGVARMAKERVVQKPDSSFDPQIALSCNDMKLRILKIL